MIPQFLLTIFLWHIYYDVGPHGFIAWFEAPHVAIVTGIVRYHYLWYFATQ